MVDKYDKLVRDRIPEIIRKNGDNPIVRVLDYDEYIRYLNAKLLEEVNEYLEDEDIDELADLLEVMYALLYAKKMCPDDLEKIRLKKSAKRGGFEDKILLVEVERINRKF